MIERRAPRGGVQFKQIGAPVGHNGHIGHGRPRAGRFQENQIGAPVGRHLPQGGIADGDILDPLLGRQGDGRLEPRHGCDRHHHARLPAQVLHAAIPA
jgi:hypothetical protein